MEPSTTLLICASAFGLGTMVLICIRHFMLSRDNKLNDKAQRAALQEEIETLSNFREEVMNSNQFTAHYQALGDNQEQIHKLNEEIEEIFNNKLSLMKHYTELSCHKTQKLNEEKFSEKNQEKYLSSKSKINAEIQFYEKELKALQARRNMLWENRDELKNLLLEEEKKRNKAINQLYQSHTTLLEKLYLRHNRNSENFATKTIEAGTQAFKLILYPLAKLLEYLKPEIFDSSTKKEKNKKKKVKSIPEMLDNHLNHLNHLNLNNERPINRIYHSSPRFFKPLPKLEQSLEIQNTKQQKQARLMI